MDATEKINSAGSSTSSAGRSSCAARCNTLRRAAERGEDLSITRAWMRYAQRHGVLAAGRTFVQRFLWGADAFVVLRAPLTGLPVEERADDIVFRLATPADLGRLGSLPDGRGGRYRTYVEEDGDWLFVACNGTDIVAAWVVSGVVPPHSLLSSVVRLGPSEVLSRDVFCSPAYREQRIAGRLVREAGRHLAALGYTDYLLSVSPTNVPSLRLSSNLQARPVLYVSYSAFLFSRRLRGSGDIPDSVWASMRRRAGAESA